MIGSCVSVEGEGATREVRDQQGIGMDRSDDAAFREHMVDN